MEIPQTYEQSGVNYKDMDPFKRQCQMAGLETAQVFKNPENFRNIFLEEYEPSRGESAYIQRLSTPAGDYCIAHVQEGLGTKNLVADAMYNLTGKAIYYAFITQDTVAMAVNDMLTSGILPSSVAMHLASEDGSWFKDEEKVSYLVKGWKHACILAGAMWGCGETSTLKDVVVPGTIELSVSALGVYRGTYPPFATSKIRPDDRILLIESSGIHANGLTWARKIADMLPNGYLTQLSGGKTYGEALLEPTIIYSKLIEKCLQAVDIHYVANITGHGWRKLMRANELFAYVIDELPQPLPIFDFIQKRGKISDAEAYGNLNMGAGFALYLRDKDCSKVIEIAQTLGLRAHVAGYIKESTSKKVVIRPKNIVFESEELAVR